LNLWDFQSELQIRHTNVFVSFLLKRGSGLGLCIIISLNKIKKTKEFILIFVRWQSDTPIFSYLINLIFKFWCLLTTKEDSYTIVPDPKVLHEQGGLQIRLYVSFLFKITLLCHPKTHQKSSRKDPAGPNEGFFKELKDLRSKIAPIYEFNLLMYPIVETIWTISSNFKKF